MASITIRRLDESVKARLRIRAAEHGHSMEEEAREILTAELTGESRDASGKSWVDEMHERFAAIGGLDIEIPARSVEPYRSPFDE